MAPALAPALSLWLPCSGPSPRAASGQLGHDTAVHHGHRAPWRWPKNPSGVAACQQREEVALKASPNPWAAMSPARPLLDQHGPRIQPAVTPIKTLAGLSAYA
jgi:hypothetical protein